MAALPPGLWSARSARASCAASATRRSKNAKGGPLLLVKIRVILEVKMNPRFQEADTHRPEDKASRADVLERAAGFDGETEAFDAGDEKFGAEAAEELRARAVV